MNTTNPPSIDWHKNAYAVIQDSCSVGNHSFAHELGHLFGLDHDGANASTPISYARGYIDTPNAFRTIMAYDNATCNPVTGADCTVRIQNFSNPDVLNGGNTTGTAAGADSARRLDETVCSTSAYRSAPWIFFDFRKLAIVQLRPIVWGPECPACNLVSKSPAWIFAGNKLLTASGSRALETTSMLSTAARSTILANASQRWLNAGETGTRLPATGIYHAALRQDGTDVTARVDASAQAYSATTVAAAVGSRPAARTKFGATMSASKRKVWVLGGVNAQGASLADAWSYDLPTRAWTKLAISGLAPDSVHSATYNASDNSIYVVDETVLLGVRGIRMLRIPAAGGWTELMGTWPALTTGTRYAVATDVNGAVYLVSSLASKDLLAVRLQRQLGVFIATHYTFAKGTLAGNSVSIVGGNLVTPVTTAAGAPEVASFSLAAFLPAPATLLARLF